MNASKLHDTDELTEPRSLADAGRPAPPQPADSMLTTTLESVTPQLAAPKLMPHFGKPKSREPQLGKTGPGKTGAGPGKSSFGKPKAAVTTSAGPAPEPLEAAPSKPEVVTALPVRSEAARVSATGSGTLEPVAARTQHSRSQATPPKLAKFKLPTPVKTRQTLLVGSTSPEAALLDPVALQRRVRRTLGGATSRLPLPIRFTCQQCHGLMEVPGESAGMETACPFCQMIQAIPVRSSVLDAAAAEATAAALEPLGEFGTSPAALQNQWAAQSVTRRRSDLTIGNVFQIAFESLFPTCLVALLHVTIAGLYAAVGLAMVFGILLLLRFIGLDPAAVQTAAWICLGIFGLSFVAVAAWFSAAVRHMALRAVRRMPFDLRQALSPGEAYGVSLIIVSAMALLSLLLRAPELVAAVSPGAIGWLGLAWMLIMFGVIVVAQTLVSFAWFAAIDGASADKAIVTSCRLVAAHLPVMIAVKVVTWLMTIPLAILTLGYALVLPIYVNATLYNLARSAGSEPSPVIPDDEF